MKTICLWPQHEANTSHITKTFYIDISTNYIYWGTWIILISALSLGLRKAALGEQHQLGISITDVVAAKKEQ